MSILVSPEWLARHYTDADVVVLDSTVVLSEPRFNGDYQAQSGRDRWHLARIPGSRFADLLGELSDQGAGYHFAMPRPGDCADALESLGVSDGKQVVVYDSRGGFWAARLWWMLHAIGVRAAVLDGGFEEWRRLGYALESGAGSPVDRGSLSVRALPGAWASLGTVRDISAGRAPGTLICALSQDAFRGKALTRYARQGHIPGSVNVPARGLFDSAGRYRPREELRALLGSVLSHDVERPLVLYCGGGISASADAFALTLVGEDRVAVYDGSLEEWAADASLPLVVEP